MTGLSKQELFNAAEKTKESIVDDLVDSRLNLKDLSVSPGSTPDTEPEVIHENPVDVPGHILSPKIVSVSYGYLNLHFWSIVLGLYIIA